MFIFKKLNNKENIFNDPASLIKLFWRLTSVKWYEIKVGFMDLKVKMHMVGLIN
jgi:hypothetical protein